MKNLFFTSLVFTLLLTSVFSQAADVTIAPPSGGGFVVKNAAGTQDRMRVQETGEITIPQLTNAASADTTLCFVAATGRLGPCSSSSVTRALQGTIQKGPYIFGSSVWISELDQNLNQNGKSYIVQTNDDFGNFNGPTITVNNVEMLGDGYYMDELSGGLSVGRLMLRAIVDLSVDPNPIINILTTIQTPRLKFLLKSGTAYAAAYSQSQREVITAFGINPDSIVNLGNLSQMNISGNRDQDAVLLSASVVLLKMAANSVVANPSSSSTAELSRLVSVMARDLEKDGVLNEASIIAARRTANTQINLPQVRTNVESYYASIGQTVTAPKFEEWVDVDSSGILPRRVVPFAGLSFTDLAAVEPNQIFTSNAVTLSGFGTGVGAAVTVTAGTTIVKNGSATSGTTATAVDGDTLALRVTSLGYGLTKSAPITVGSSSATWHVATKPLGGTITGLTSSGLVLQNNGGGNNTIPAGSTSFTFPASVANGAGYSVSVLTQPSTPLQVCTVTNGAGTVGAAPSNISVTCLLQSRLVLTTNFDGNSVGVFSTDQLNTRMDPVNGSPFMTAAGSMPWSIAADYTGKFVYVGIQNRNMVAAYTINKGTGALSPTAGSPFAAGSTPYSIVVDPSGKFVYVANSGSNDISAYTIDATTGALTVIAGSPFATGTTPYSITVDPTGKFAYVASEVGISAYTINATTGALTPTAGNLFGAGTRPYTIAADPTGKFIYAASQFFNLYVYAVDPTTGALTPVAGSPISTGTNSARSITVDPTGKFAYVGGGDGVSAYTINAGTGTPTLIAGSPFVGGQFVTAESGGKYLYTSKIAGSTNIKVYSIDGSTGSLTSEGTFVGYNTPSSLAIIPIP